MSDLDEMTDDFFAELEDNEFLDEIVETVVPEDGMLPSSDENDVDKDQESMDRCLREIDKLTKNIQRRKKKLQRELDEKKVFSRSRSKELERVGTSGKHSRSPPIRRSYRRSASPPRRSIPVRRYSPPKRRPSPKPTHSRSRPSRSPPRYSRFGRSARNRSRSPIVKRRRTKSPESKPLTFLEELEKKFAEQGKEFPEKQLLLASQTQNDNKIKLENPIPEPPNMIARFPVQPNYNEPINQIPPPPIRFQINSSSSLVINPLARLPVPAPITQISNAEIHNEPPPPPPPPIVPPPPPIIVADQMKKIRKSTSELLAELSTKKSAEKGGSSGLKPASNLNEVTARCDDAIKLLRGEENKLPKLRFICTKSFKPVQQTEMLTPLHGNQNVQFQFSSKKVSKDIEQFQGLGKRTTAAIRALCFNSVHVISKLKMKQIAQNVITDMEESKKKAKKCVQNDAITQTTDYKCGSCEVHDSKLFLNQAVQVHAVQKSVRIQTDGIDYRDTAIATLSKMTPAQLLAVTDFAALFNNARPSNSVEMYELREKLMDIYNLSGRPDAIVRSEEDRQRNETRVVDVPGGLQRFDMFAAPRQTVQHENLKVIQHVDRPYRFQEHPVEEPRINNIPLQNVVFIPPDNYHRSPPRNIINREFHSPRNDYQFDDEYSNRNFNDSVHRNPDPPPQFSHANTRWSDQRSEFNGRNKIRGTVHGFRGRH